MKYIIMCGGKYKFSKQLMRIKGEVLVERTVRLLREAGVEDIAVSTNNPEFEYLDVEILHHENEYTTGKKNWVDAYYPMEEPCCYIHGDVYFSPEAIRTIVETECEDTMFFCTCDGTDRERDPRNWKGREPFAFKVVNQEVFKYCIKKLKGMLEEFWLTPIAWHVYRYLNGMDLKKEAREYTEINDIFHSKGDYVVIDDYTTDVDNEWEIEEIEKHVW